MIPGLAGPGPGGGETAVDDRPPGEAWGVETPGTPVVAPAAAPTQALPRPCERRGGTRG